MRGGALFWNFISIHTPAKGVTTINEVSFDKIIISIHTPAKGVTHIAHQFVNFVCISIHTPAKGVTLPRWANDIKIFNFNPHPREGGDIFVRRKSR